MQIKAFKADIIICGGTHHFINRDIAKMLSNPIETNPNNIIKSYHPMQRTISDESFYTNILELSKEIINKD